jgi:Tol biopolymer transport system component
LDGTNEKTLATYQAPGVHFNRIAWTADGKSLVYPLQAYLMTIPYQGGVARRVSNVRWKTVDDLWSLPPGPDLIVIGSLADSVRPQVFVASADGTVRPITHDLSNYIQVRTSADGSAILAVQDVIRTSIQVASAHAQDEPRSLSAGNENYDGVTGLAWTPDGHIVYLSVSDKGDELLEMDGNGANPRRLAGSDQLTDLTDPAVSPTGDFIALPQWSEDDRANILRLDLKTGTETRLTSGTQDFHPSIAPDGQWVIYGSVQGDEPVLMKVPSQGGAEVKLTDYNADDPAVSPDGKWIACVHIPHPGAPASLAIVPMAGGLPIRTFPLPESAVAPPLVWTRDSRAVAFINNANGVGNIWQQPVDGGPATPLTHFNTDQIFSFQWSRDGRLALSRGTRTTDAVVIHNFSAIHR